MLGNECPQIVLSNADYAAKSVPDETAGIDPSADRTGRDAETFCDLGNLQEIEIVAAMAMTDFAVGSQFHVAVDAGPRSIAVDARPSARGHFSPFSATAPPLRPPIDRRSISAFQRSSCLRLRKFRPLIWMRGGKFRSGSRCQRHPVMDEMPSSFQTCGSGTKVSVTSATSSDESVLFLVTRAALANVRAKNKQRDRTKKAARLI
jgi:hypothetical protein